MPVRPCRMETTTLSLGGISDKTPARFVHEILPLLVLCSLQASSSSPRAEAFQAISCPFCLSWRRRGQGGVGEGY